MTHYSVFVPHLVSAVALLVIAACCLLPGAIAAGISVCALFHWQRHGRPLGPQRVAGLGEETWRRLVLGAGLAVLLAIVGGMLLPWAFSQWMRAEPSPRWEDGLRAADTVIVFGFGFGRDAQGRVTPGAANQFLLDWTLERTNADTLLVQEGVFMAAERARQENRLGNRQVLRMHLHDPARDINTMKAAYCTLALMESLGRKRAVVVAHDVQLARAAADLRALAAENPRWRDMEFVVPAVPHTPYPGDSAQWRTRTAWLYRFFELYLSRPRDVCWPKPTACEAPAR